MEKEESDRGLATVVWWWIENGHDGLGKGKKRDRVRASDEMGSGNEMALVIFKLIEGHYGNF